MENIAQFLIFSSSIFLFFTINPAQSATSCKPESCHSRGPRVRFPFRLKARQPARCGYPGFDLYCNSRNETILNLPRSGEFIVDYIDYKSQALFIDDLGSCLPNRSLDFSLSGSPFRAPYLTNFSFFNCSDGWTDYASARDYVPLTCLSERNHTVLAVNSDSPTGPAPPPCRRMADVSVPLWWTFPQFYFEVVWSQPDCGRCENRGGICGFKGDSGQEIGCSKPSGTGLPRSAKYAIIVGVGIPGLLCMIGLACYTCGKIKTVRHRHRINSELPTSTVFDQRPAIRANSGLDLPTIESYPKMVLGQSGRLPKPSDSTCSICLCEYQPKDTLRSIPECNHYFHAGCIDEWLKVNGTCPVCRNSPDRSSTSTHCSSTSSSSSSSPSSTSSDHE